jgi:hypothetical protein
MTHQNAGPPLALCQLVIHSPVEKHVENHRPKSTACGKAYPQFHPHPVENPDRANRITKIQFARQPRTPPNMTGLPKHGAMPSFDSPATWPKLPAAHHFHYGTPHHLLLMTVVEDTAPAGQLGQAG